MAYLTSPMEVQLGPQGRLVIPAQLRRLVGFEPGAGGVDVDGLREDVEALGLSIFPFTSFQGG